MDLQLCVPRACLGGDKYSTFQNEGLCGADLFQILCSFIPVSLLSRGIKKESETRLRFTDSMSRDLGQVTMIHARFIYRLKERKWGPGKSRKSVRILAMSSFSSYSPGLSSRWKVTATDSSEAALFSYQQQLQLCSPDLKW